MDTSKFRRAIWNYIQCIYGIRHDDYDYGEVNQLLERPLKMFIKTACCFPERITKSDYDSILKELQHSEKVGWWGCGWQWRVTNLASVFSGPRKLDDLGGKESSRAVVRLAWNYALYDVILTTDETRRSDEGDDEDDLWARPNITPRRRERHGSTDPVQLYPLIL